MKSTLILSGLNCPHCAAKIEEKIKNDHRFGDVEFNFMNKQLSLYHEMEEPDLIAEISSIVSSIEDGVTVLSEKGSTIREEDEETGKKFLSVLRAGTVIVLLLVYFFLFKNPWIIILAYIAAGADVILKAVKNIAKGQIFDENFLMSIATIGAIILGEYTEALAVMVFYQIGEFFQDLAVDKSRKSIAELMDLQTDTADIIKDGEIITVSPNEIRTGDTLLIRSGAKFPVDGIVCEGSTTADTSALTGESMPQTLDVGSNVLSGCINLGAAVKITAENTADNSTASKISRMAENAAAHKSKAENFISVFAKIYTPAVVVFAVLLAVVPCLISGFDQKWIYRSLIFLVASCPCALVLSVPLCFFSGIGKASKQGVLIKGSSYIQTLAKIKMAVFDKTGTLTTGKFTVETTDENLLVTTAALERYSTHPIAKAIVSACKSELPEAENIEEISGFGITGTIGGRNTAVGSEALMQRLGIDTGAAEGDVYTAQDGKLIGAIKVSDTIKPESSTAVHAIEALGIKTAMLTGDKKETAIKVCRKLGMSDAQYELLPDQKLVAVQKLRKKYGSTAFVGDGINDAPVLAGADVGIAMGGIGSDAAIEAADMVIIGDSPTAVLRVIETSRRTMSILKQNIFFILIVKAVILLLTAFGLSNMWLAVFADVGTALLSVLNSARILR